MHLETRKIPNGDILVNFHFYACNRCETTIKESDPHHRELDNHYCMDCAFILSKIIEEEYLNSLPIKLSDLHAEVVDGKLITWQGKNHPLKRKNKDERNTKRYSDWRIQVFKRDGYTCQHCSQVGGELNAHHIKEFAKYKDLRFEVDNGLTLCVSCHRKVHKKTG